MHEVIPQRSLREKQRQEREDLILQVAEDVLLEKGYHETSMDEIAARVGIAKGTLYLHFARKEDLIFAIFQRSMQAGIQEIEKACEIEGTAQEKLEAILYSMTTELFNKRAQLLHAVYHSVDLQTVFKDRLKEKPSSLKETLERISGRIAALLDEGKANGSFDPEVPTEVMLGFFLSSLSPMTYKRIMADEKMSTEELARYVGCIFFRGIAADSRRKE